MTTFVLAFLCLSITLYVLLAGADFGAGILETFLRDEDDKRELELVSHSIAPVWEANHIWSILAIVILFVAFPPVFSEISISFHIPLLVMLVGITLRGCAFTFRHYDVGDSSPERYYSRVFVASSWLTPFCQGVVAGGCLAGRVNPGAATFYDRYVGPWCNVFSFSVGAFFCSICAFLASTYLIGEANEQGLQSRFRNRSRVILGITGFLALAVFGAAEISDVDLFSLFVDHVVSLFAMVCAGLVAMILVAAHPAPVTSRMLAAGFATAVVSGWMALQFPDLIVTKSFSTNFDAYRTASPAATLKFLLAALIAGSSLIFPALYFLFITFKRTEPSS